MTVAVAVTGLGVTTPLGGDLDSTWEALLAGRSGVKLLDPEWAPTLPVRIAAPVAVDPTAVLDRIEARRLDRVQQLALVAAREAWADAGSPEVDGDRLAVVVSSGIGGVGTLLASAEILAAKGPRLVSPNAVPMLMPNGPAATVALAFGARAGAHAPVSACAAGSEALSLALDLLRLGRADVVICGGSEAAIQPVTMAGFASMRALSMRNDEPARASRPYDKARDGFVLGEGAGILVLETEEHAAARGARVLGRLAGSAITSDAYHVAAPDPEGRGAARAIVMALRDAGLEPADLIHVNPHATSTPVGDVAEALALRTALGAHLEHMPVSATKSALGHLLGAAGAVEAALTIRALQTHTAPPTLNVDDPDDEIDLDVVRLDPRPLAASGAALSTSFGFGGHNVALVFRP